MAIVPDEPAEVAIQNARRYGNFLTHYLYTLGTMTFSNRYVDYVFLLFMIHMLPLIRNDTLYTSQGVFGEQGCDANC